MFCFLCLPCYFSIIETILVLLSLVIHYAKLKWRTFHRYKVIENLAQGGFSLVEWRLETGRTHQVRIVHFLLLKLLQRAMNIYYNPSNNAFSPITMYARA